MQRVERYDAFDIPVASIYYDSDFNCRGEFTPQAVFELSQSIEMRGLDFPVVLQRACDVKGGLPENYEYRLLCGHRRFKAVTQFLKWTSIPATIRIGLTDREARLLNLTENLERHDLNPLEEAVAIHRLFPEGATLETAARELKRSINWVKTRFDVLRLPEELQQLVAARVLSLRSVSALMSLPATMWIEAARKAVLGDRTGIMAPVGRRWRRAKKRTEIITLIERMFELGLSGLYTRLLSWTMGHVTDEEILQEIVRQAGRRHELPRDANDCKITQSPGDSTARCQSEVSPRGDAADGDDHRANL